MPPVRPRGTSRHRHANHLEFRTLVKYASLAPAVNRLQVFRPGIRGSVVSRGTSGTRGDRVRGPASPTQRREGPVRPMSRVRRQELPGCGIMGACRPVLGRRAFRRWFFRLYRFPVCGTPRRWGAVKPGPDFRMGPGLANFRRTVAPVLGPAGQLDDSTHAILRSLRSSGRSRPSHLRCSSAPAADRSRRTRGAKEPSRRSRSACARN